MSGDTTRRFGAAPESLLSDPELLARHLGGDPVAFGTLVRRHQDRLWAVALRTLGDREEAADALQDALLSAFRGAAGYRGDAAVTTWLHRIVVNACLDRVRRRQARPTVPLPPDDRAPATRDEVDRLELAADLDAALALLPDEQRVPLVLVDVHGYPVDEVARLLDIPTGTVKSRCARARAKLAAALGPRRRAVRATAGNPSPPRSVPLSARADEEVSGDE